MNYFLCSPTWWTEKFIDYAAVSFNVSPSPPSSNFPMQITLLSLASIWAMYFTLLSILAMPGSLDMNKATGNVELLGVPYAAAPTDTPPPGLLRPFTNRVFTGDAQSQPPEVTAGIKMTDTQSCTYWFSTAVGRLSFSQVRSEIQLVSFYLFMRFLYCRTPF